MITMTTIKLLSCKGGDILLPQWPMIGRSDGGNLWVVPPREVWERSELTRDELTNWSFLIAATGKAMLEVLPQLKGGCINYWEAGNWALNTQCEPSGFKLAKNHRKVHMHILGRSPQSTDPDWQWGEAPKFPSYADSKAWSATKEHLHASECDAIVSHVEQELSEKYAIGDWNIQSRFLCSSCQYPVPASHSEEHICLVGRPRAEATKTKDISPAAA